MARPTEYNYEILKPLIEEYLKESIDIEEDKENNIKQKVRIPTIEGLALKLGINKTTIYEWCKIYEEFSNDIERVRHEQAKRLIDKGLSNDYNPTIAKVLLTKHGYIDKQDVTSDGKAIKGNSIVFTNFKDETNS